MTFDFSKGPYESRRAFWQLIAQAPQHLQNRIADLMWAVVFKNELPELVESLTGDFCGAETGTADLGASWTEVFDTDNFIDAGTPGTITIPTGKAGYYEIKVDGYIAGYWPRPQ